MPGFCGASSSTTTSSVIGSVVTWRSPGFAKEQLLLILREWYMHPNGQMPAYGFDLSDVNPPVHAWACWRVYKMTGKRGERDRDFLAWAGLVPC